MSTTRRKHRKTTRRYYYVRSVMLSVVFAFLVTLSIFGVYTLSSNNVDMPPARTGEFEPPRNVMKKLYIPDTYDTTVDDPVEDTDSTTDDIIIAAGSYVYDGSVSYEEPEYTYTNYDVPLSDDLKEFVHNACEYYGFDEKTLYQMMHVESRFDPEAVNNAGTHLGILQIGGYGKSYIVMNDDYDQYISTETYDRFNPYHSVIIALRMLDYWDIVCSDRGYDEQYAMLECYNRGFNFFKNPSNTVYSDSVYAVEISVVE